MCIRDSTYLGNGDAADSDTFTVGGHTIHSNDPIGTSFVYTVTAGGDLPFSYANLDTHYAISDKAFSPIQDLAYGLFFGPKPGIAYIGLTDLPIRETTISRISASGSDP